MERIEVKGKTVEDALTDALVQLKSLRNPQKKLQRNLS